MKKKLVLKEFLEDYPLYSKYKLVSYPDGKGDEIIPKDLEGLSFRQYCELEKEYHTFTLTLDSAIEKLYELFRNESNSDYLPKFEFIRPYKGICSSCKKYEVLFFLRVWSDKPIFLLKSKLSLPSFGGDPTVNIWIQKIGQFPAVNSDHFYI